MLSREQVIKLAKLSRIELTEAEVEKFRDQLSTVLDFIDQLQKVDTEGVGEVFEVTGLENVQRADKIVEAQNHEEILSQAPEIKDGYFKVKSIF